MIRVTRWEDGKAMCVNPATLRHLHEAERLEVDPATNEKTGVKVTVTVLTPIDQQVPQLVVAEDMETVYRRCNGTDL